jgi:GGDEF domain-containing protein
MKRLSRAFNASLRGSPAFAVLYLDIDDFKDVNDTLVTPWAISSLRKSWRG